MSKKSPALLLGCALLTACHSGSDLNVQATWGKNLSALGITPIYPPTEDLQVGDIELYVQNPCDTGIVSNQPQAIRLGSIPLADVQAALEDSYNQRQNLPSTSKPAETKPATSTKATATTPAAKAEITTTGSATVSLSPAGQASTGAAQATSTSTTSSSPAVQPQPSADAQHPIFPGKSKNPITRLRITAFPDFSFSDFSSGGIGAVIPAHAVNVSAGIAGQKSKIGMVSVAQVEEEGLPAIAMYDLVESFLEGPSGAKIVNRDKVEWWKSFLEERMIEVSGCERHSSKGSFLVFIGHIYYARTFNYNFSQSEAVAAGLRVALAVATAASSSTSSNTTPTATTTSANPAQVAGDAAASALKDLGGGSSPGGAASLEIGSQGGLTLKQSFDRPLAFGVDQPMIWHTECALRVAAHNNATGCNSLSQLAGTNINHQQFASTRN